MKSDIISCEDSLKALASSPAAELVGQTPLAQHLASCPDCSRVGSVVLERERSLRLALDSLTSRADPIVITEAAILANERHGTARFVRWLLLGALGVTIWFAMDGVLGPLDKARPDLVVETIPFTCLWSPRAVQLVEPYVRSNGHGIYPALDRAITIRATAAEIAQARTVLAKFDAQVRKSPDAKYSCQDLPPAATPKSAPTPATGPISRP